MRTTVSIDPTLAKRVREHQARLLVATGRNVTFNDALNSLLALGVSALSVVRNVDHETHVGVRLIAESWRRDDPSGLANTPK